MSGITEQPTDRRRQTRTPVDINALLIGEKTVPRGCRVINVSQYGMLLYCEADGRLSTFNDGDNVDIHLTVQHAGKQKKLTIPSYVRRVADNSVDVEFHHPDPILMDLIESYRVSGEHRLEASLGQNHTQPEIHPRAGATGKGPRQPPELRVPDTGPGPQKPFFRGLLFLLFTLCVAGGGYIYTASIDSRIGALETTSGKLGTDVQDLKKRIFSASLQEGRYASLNARITALGDDFARLEDKLTLLVPASRSPGTTSSNSTSPQKPVTAVPSATSRMAQPSPSPGQKARPIASAPLAGPAEAAAADANEAATVQTVPPHTGSAATHAVSSPAPAPEARRAEPGADSTPATATTSVAERGSAAQPDVTAAPAQGSPSGVENNQTAYPASGPWVINLASSPRKGDITRMATIAAAADIPTHIEQAEVKGRHYWRLQTGGYPSLAVARTAAAPIKAALKLDNVWFLKKNNK
jgi:hypothetical protein